MKIHYYPIASTLHDVTVLDAMKQSLSKNLLQWDIEVTESSLDQLYQADVSVILIQSGGSEAEFLRLLPKLKAPIYLLTFGSNNSLAASMEILSFLNQKAIAGKIIHGTMEQIKNQLLELSLPRKVQYRYGVLGKPSDWLIASQVDSETIQKLHQIELVPIDLGEVEAAYEKAEGTFQEEKFPAFSEVEINKAMKLYRALRKIAQDHRLNGFTIRCFDLLKRLCTTSCLALSLLYRDGILTSCEGDIPSLLSMHIVYQASKQYSFQANPSRIDVEKKEIVFAHCTIPLSLVNAYQFDTHFESGIGIGIRGELATKEITIFKMDADLRHFVLMKGMIKENLREKNLCRTQILVRVEEGEMDYFLQNPYGNHHIIIYGDVRKAIQRFIARD